MDFVVRKTTELTEKDIEQINALFHIVFEKERSREEFLNQTVNNPFGYSYHALMIEDGEIVGMNTFVPSYYTYKGEKMIFANSTDSMVAKKYRDFFNFNDMVLAGFKEMKKDGVKFVYGYPNDNAYPVLIKAKLYRDIGKMHTYCLPLHVGGVKPSFKLLNPFSEAFCRIYIGLQGLFSSSREDKYEAEKDSQSYNETRYRRADGNYMAVKLDDFTVYYKIVNHEGVRTAFLIDITKKSPQTFNKAVKYIVKNHRKSFDLLLYPGFLKFRNTSMFKIPRKFEPKNFNFTGRALDKKAFGEEIWDINNWDTNLSNYDLI